MLTVAATYDFVDYWPTCHPLWQRCAGIADCSRLQRSLVRGDGGGVKLLLLTAMYCHLECSSSSENTRLFNDMVKCVCALQLCVRVCCAIVCACANLMNAALRFMT